MVSKEFGYVSGYDLLSRVLVHFLELDSFLVSVDFGRAKVILYLTPVQSRVRSN